MTFLNPLYLLALAAAAIPIILHLLNLRKTRVIEFSSLTFLKELQRSQIRKLKLRQLLLLILRTLIVICIVMAFSRPAFRGSVGNILGSHAKTSVVIILDDSFSMLATDDGGQLLKQAKAKAKNILELLQPGDEVALIKTSNPQKDLVQFTAAHNAIIRDIDQTQQSYAHVHFNDALTTAHLLLSKSQNFNKEIYVITDEQRSHFISTDNNVKQPIALFDDRMKVFLFPLGSEQMNNTAVVSMQVQNSLFEKNKPVTLSATILNGSNRSLRGDVVSLYLAGERVMQKSIDIDAGARKEIEFTALPKSSGFIEGFVQLEDDLLPEDNRRYFSFYVPDKIHILVASEKAQDALFIKLALSSTQLSAGENIFDVSYVEGGQTLSANLKKYDVVILLAGKSITSGFAERFASFVKDGGNAYVLPASDGDTPNTLSAIFSSMQLPSTGGVIGVRGSKSSFTQFGKIDFAHPLFTGIFLKTNEKKQPQVESPKIYYAVKLPASEKLQTIIATSANQSFLSEYHFGNGKILLCSSAPMLEWTDFPLKGLFVPLMNRAMYYLASRDYNSLAHTIGETFEVMLPYSSDHASAYTIITPSKKETRIVPKSLVSGLYFLINNTDEPGNYILKSDAEIMRVIPVNVDPAESDLTRVTKSERDAFWKSLGVKDVHVLQRDTDIHRVVMETRFGLELWKYFLIAALLFAIVEMLVARDAKKKELELSAS